MVYPHVYGGNLLGLMSVSLSRGLSPCVRGKPDYDEVLRPMSRSIPMCTGETHSEHSCTTQLKVYPHVYGGNRIMEGF